MPATGKWQCLALALLLAGCAGDGGPTALPSSGAPGAGPDTPPAAVIRIVTAGHALDGDGYTIEVAGLLNAVATNDSLVLTDLARGSYEVRLRGVAANCITVAGSDRRDVVVREGSAPTVQFSVLCSPTAPAQTTSASSISTPACWRNGTGCTPSELAAWENAERGRLQANARASRRRFNRLSFLWDLYLWAFPQGQSLFVICTPTEYAGTTMTIGPEGGDLPIGPHMLRIPAGALSKPVVITGAAPVSFHVEVELQPHGLQFAPGVTLELSYRHCDQPNRYVHRAAYVDESGNVLEWPTSTDNRGQDVVHAEIDHFSKYAVAY